MEYRYHIEIPYECRVVMIKYSLRKLIRLTTEQSVYPFLNSICAYLKVNVDDIFK